MPVREPIQLAEAALVVYAAIDVSDEDKFKQKLYDLDYVQKLTTELIERDEPEKEAVKARLSEQIPAFFAEDSLVDLRKEDHIKLIEELLETERAYDVNKTSDDFKEVNGKLSEIYANFFKNARLSWLEEDLKTWNKFKIKIEDSEVIFSNKRKLILNKDEIS